MTDATTTSISTKAQKFYGVGKGVPLSVAYENNFSYPLSDDLLELFKTRYDMNLTDISQKKIEDKGSDEEEAKLLGNTHPKTPLIKRNDELIRVVRVYEQVVETPLYGHHLADLESGEATGMMFPSANRDHPTHVFSRLMFRRRTREWMTFAREGEKNCFGFSSEQSGGKTEFFLPLAYPGLSGSFVPVYVGYKGEHGLRYFVIEAKDGPQREVVVRVRKVPFTSVPFELIKSAGRN